MNINHKQLRQVLSKAWDTKKPVDIKGTIGIGKSQHIREFAIEKAKELKLKFFEWNQEQSKNKLYAEEAFYFVDIRLSQVDPTDLRGIPDTNGTVTLWKPNLVWARLSNPDAQGIVFFDEANTTNTSVLKACYQIIHDRQVGEHPISPGILFVSAGNLLTDQCDVVEEPMALNNRRLNYVLTLDHDDWEDWATKNGIDERIVAFLACNKDQLIQEKPTTAAFASPRTWQMLSDLIKDEKSIEMIRIFAYGTVGDVAQLFISFLENKDGIKIRDVFNNPSLVKTLTPSQTYRVVSLLLYEYKTFMATLDEVLEIVIVLEPEYAVLALRLLAKNTNDWTRKAMKCPNWKFVLEKFGTYL